MVKLTLAEIRELNDGEIAVKIDEYEKERYALRFKAATEVVANPMDIRHARRMVARLQTVLAERAAKAKAP